MPVPAALDLSAYRIVQEGLTNVLKHAEGAHADVRVRYAVDRIHLEVSNDGRGVDHALEPGYGLLGIQERVKIYGGTMTTGPRPGGGFSLCAELPLGHEVRR